jgi:hypothetical protein
LLLICPADLIQKAYLEFINQDCREKRPAQFEKELKTSYCTRNKDNGQARLKPSELLSTMKTGQQLEKSDLKHDP